MPVPDAIDGARIYLLGRAKVLLSGGLCPLQIKEAAEGYLSSMRREAQDSISQLQSNATNLQASAPIQTP